MKPKNSHAMTLRLDPRLDDLLTDASYDARLSKAAWIRRAIERCLQRQQPALR
jgi:predicted transcriptional regulator